MFELLPGVLAYNEPDFKACLLHPGLNQVAKTFHVDVLDGSLFNNMCWAEAEVVGAWDDLPEIELHCMVQNPIPQTEAWHRHVPTLKRVIVHQEINRPLIKAIAHIRGLGVEVITAVNPLTPVDNIAGETIDALMIMGYEPGRSGQPFLGDQILAKIRRAKALFPNLPIAVDGGVSSQNIGAIIKAGASRCVATSALWQAENPEESYRELMLRGD